MVFTIILLKRLFLIYEFIKKYNIQKCLYLENDVLLYKNFTDFNFKNKIYLTMDNHKRCVPGILYIPEQNIFKKFIDNYL